MKKLIDNMSEICLLTGFGFIIYASYLHNNLFGYCVTGILFVVLAIILAKEPQKENGSKGSIPNISIKKPKKKTTPTKH